MAIALLPAFLVVPGAVAKAWRTAEARTVGLNSVRIVAIGIAAWGLFDRFVEGSPRAAMPLGHHNLLAGVLVALLPVVFLGVRSSEVLSTRILSSVGALVVVAAIAATGSLLAAVAVGVQLLLAVLWRVRLHKLLLPSALLILALQMPRVASIFRGQDTSTQARITYLEAGWRGLAARPWLGWGAGSTPWTIGLHMRPVAGVNPPGEVIGDLHSLPLQILYELGGIGFAFTLGTAAYFLRRRIRERADAVDPALLAAGLIGLLGAAVTRLGGASLSILAMPLTVGIAAGAALAGGAAKEAGNLEAAVESKEKSGWVGKKKEKEQENGQARKFAGSGAGWVGWLGVALAVAVLAGPLLGTWHYERARLATTPAEGVERLAQASRWDAAFPLYPDLLSFLSEGNSGRSSALAREGATGTPGVAAAWLLAGDVAARGAVDLPTARESWRRAYALDPLGGAAPALRLAWNVENRSSRAEWLARALVAEPRYLAAMPAERVADVLTEALALIERMEGIDAGWRQRLLETAARVAEVGEPLADGDRSPIALSFDTVPRDSLALHVFRRLPWPTDLAPVDLDRRKLALIDLPPATSLRGTVLPPPPSAD